MADGDVIMDDNGGDRGGLTPRGQTTIQRKESRLIDMDELTDHNRLVHTIPTVTIQKVVVTGKTGPYTKNTPNKVTVFVQEVLNQKPHSVKLIVGDGNVAVLVATNEALQDVSSVYQTTNPAIITKVDVDGQFVTLPDSDPVTVTVTYE
jgi:hypothetical protein